MKNNKDIIILAFTILVIACIYIYKHNEYKNAISALQGEIEFYTDSLNRYTKLYNSASLSELKKENKELYNQVKAKDNLIDALQFIYKYKYVGKEEIIDTPIETDSLYHFNVQTDTMGYDLKVWSTHLQKYKLMFNLTNKFTITKQQIGDNNRTEINSYLPGRIEGVTTWSQKTKKQRFLIGPSIGVGYGLLTKKPDVFIGVTVTYNLTK